MLCRAREPRQSIVYLLSPRQYPAPQNWSVESYFMPLWSTGMMRMPYLSLSLSRSLFKQIETDSLGG